MSVLFRSTRTYLEMILLSSFFTQGASGSRQISCPELFRVALPKSNRIKSILNIKKRQNIVISPGTIGMRWRTVELDLTWSPPPRSESWKESDPPYWCGVQWVFSQSRCSGSAAPLPDFFWFLCFFLQEITYAFTPYWAVLYESGERTHWGVDKDHAWK